MNASHPDSYTPAADGEHRRQRRPSPVTRNALEACLSRLPGKRARPVLRGPRRSNAPGLPDERWFRELTDKRLRRGVFHSVPDLINAIDDYLAVNNADPKPFIWTATAESILAKVQQARTSLQQAVNQ